MYTEEHITSAIDAGIFTRETAAAFRSHVQQMQSISVIDEEHFRLVTGFNDIFVVIACLLSLTSVAWIGSVFSPWFGSFIVAVVAWVLAEFFVRKRRMALPAIVLLLAFVGSTYTTLYTGLHHTSSALIIAAGVAGLVAWVHWLRFRVPITVAAGVVAAAGFVVAIMLKLIPDASQFLILISLIVGLAIFTIAMRWDMADQERLTRKSDVAFWLHLLAAPLLVHPVFSVLSVSGETSLIQAVAVIGLYGLIALVSLAIDRRALMVSALGYVLYVFSALLKMYGVVSLGFAITALVIGAALLLLSAFWHPCRTLVLKQLPAKIQVQLPPIR
jgi:hypothetical protein